MRSFSVSPTAQRVLWFLFNVGAPVVVLSAVVLLPILTGATNPSGSSASPQTGSALSDADAGALRPIRISRLLNSAVSGPDRKLVGTVRDVLLDHGGNITAVTMDVGAFLGVHTRTVAIPIDKLRLVSGAEVPASPAPSPSAAPGTDVDGSATIMEDLMSGNGRAWQVGAADHIEVGLTRKELKQLPSYAGE